MTELPARTLRIGLASPRNAATVDERLDRLDRFLDEAADRQVAVVAFPECYIPGLRGLDFDVPAHDQQRQERALDRISQSAGRYGVAVIVGMEWEVDGALQNVAVVVSGQGDVLGMQTKNQIPPSEEPFYTPGNARQLFEIDGVPVGITICHEGWRFPESVRWAAANGAKIVFHPQMTGIDLTGPSLHRWGDPAAPYYEKAMVARAVENTIYFASINYAMTFQESATTLVDPEGEVVAWVPYGDEALLVADIDLDLATGFYAHRLNRDQYATDPS
ncbi:MAG: carbon-nitrogen hydrolase family protein [Thermomicrobiales bacterium]|nr:carbon-nitrogen hydrolase family protein [Thermomicrobiales bacterium]